jgi:long-subunit acyl-CoA synthetase (AMP-forming)
VLAATSLEWAVCDFAIWAAGLVTSLMPVTSADGAIRAAASLGGPGGAEG